MRYQSKKKYVIALLAVLCLLLSGCQFTPSPEKLYQLPRLPAQYTELQNSIKSIKESGAAYAAPVSGTNIQPVQMTDLDNDGREEALCFFHMEDAENPLWLCIFAPDNSTYTSLATIEGSGEAFYSIAYEDLDGDGMTELIIGWRISTELQALSVYSLKHGQPEELMHTTYVRYAVTDLDQDGLKELVVMRAGSENESVADFYAFTDGVLGLRSTAKISMNMAELSDVRCGMLSDNVPALFVTGVSDTEVEITDVLAAPEGNLTNVVLSAETGVTKEVYPFMSLYPTDLNHDGFTELPVPYPVPVFGADDETAYCVNWCTVDTEGRRQTTLMTWHDPENGWYLQLPEDWIDTLSVLRRSVGLNETAITFFQENEGSVLPSGILSIYTITGDSREYKALQDNRFILGRQGETVYAAEILPQMSTLHHPLTEEELRAMFSPIYTEWNPGHQ